MQNHSTVLDQITWGIHLNFEGHFASPPNHPSWLTQLQQQDWQQRGIVVWAADPHIVAHLYAGYALKLLERLQGDDAWKTEGCVIGSPAFQFSTNSVSTPSTILGTDQTQTLVEFLSAQESLLKRISMYDKEDAKQAINKVYQAAQICCVTSKQIRAWIRRGRLEAFNLPGLGIVIEAGKLNEFLYQIRFIQNSPTPEISHKP